jgi:hypothetical protein
MLRFLTLLKPICHDFIPQEPDVPGKIPFPLVSFVDRFVYRSFISLSVVFFKKQTEPYAG